MRRSKFSLEYQERAVRLVFEQQDQYPSQWNAIVSVAGKVGCSPEVLRRWVRQREQAAGLLETPAGDEKDRVKVLERENRELRRANEILRLASAFFAQAELDRQSKR